MTILQSSLSGGGGAGSLAPINGVIPLRSSDNVVAINGETYLKAGHTVTTAGAYPDANYNVIGMQSPVVVNNSIAYQDVNGFNFGTTFPYGFCSDETHLYFWTAPTNLFTVAKIDTSGTFIEQYDSLVDSDGFSINTTQMWHNPKTGYFQLVQRNTSSPAEGMILSLNPTDFTEVVAFRDNTMWQVNNQYDHVVDSNGLMYVVSKSHFTSLGGVKSQTENGYMPIDVDKYANNSRAPDADNDQFNFVMVDDKNIIYFDTETGFDNWYMYNPLTGRRSVLLSTDDVSSRTSLIEDAAIIGDNLYIAHRDAGAATMTLERYPLTRGYGIIEDVVDPYNGCPYYVRVE